MSNIYYSFQKSADTGAGASGAGPSLQGFPGVTPDFFQQSQPQAQGQFHTSKYQSNSFQQQGYGNQSSRQAIRRAQSRHFETFNSNSGNNKNLPPLSNSGLVSQNMPYDYYDSAAPDQRFDSQRYDAGQRGSYILGSDSTWMNFSGASSIRIPNNGANASGNTSRNVLAPQWVDPTPPLSAGDFPSASALPPFAQQQSLGSMRQPNSALPPSAYSPPGSLSPPKSDTVISSDPSISAADEELIPTAIVIKNIPFSIKKEQLLDIMMGMGLAMPYAFNYHFDAGIFRGLAFANFANPEETGMVISALNGHEIAGRKLRVEYKKMLPLAERERIEREKRSRRGQLEEQHRTNHLMHMPSSGNLLSQNTASMVNMVMPTPMSMFPPNVPSQQQGKFKLPLEVNLNDPETLNFYSEILLFRDDRSRDELVYPGLISGSQRRVIHILAQNMGLILFVRNEGEERETVIARPNSSNYSQTNLPAPSLVHSSSTASALLDMPSTLGHNSAQQPSKNLRGTKSFADIRSTARLSAFHSLQHQHQHQHQQSPYMNYPALPVGASSLIQSFSNVNLSSGGSAVSHSGTSSSSSTGTISPSFSLQHQQPLRQPRGPDASDRGFMIDHVRTLNSRSTRSEQNLNQYGVEIIVE